MTTIGANESCRVNHGWFYQPLEKESLTLMKIIKIALYYIPYVGEKYFGDDRPSGVCDVELAKRNRALKRGALRSAANQYAPITIKLTMKEWIYSLLGWSSGSISGPSGAVKPHVCELDPLSTEDDEVLPEELFILANRKRR